MRLGLGGIALPRRPDIERGEAGGALVLCGPPDETAGVLTAKDLRNLAGAHGGVEGTPQAGTLDGYAWPPEGRVLGFLVAGLSMLSSFVVLPLGC